MYMFSTMFLQFLIYSILGWIIESISCSIYYKKTADRGFLLGPYCPIYGISAILMISILDKYKNNQIILFIFSMIIATILEYITSYVLEKLFKTRWWDYSYRVININGRICLINSLIFGFFGVILINIINPIIINFFRIISIKILYPLTFILLIIFTIDIVTSCAIITNLKKTSDMLKKDCSSLINPQIRKTISKKSKVFSIKGLTHSQYHLISKKIKNNKN